MTDPLPALRAMLPRVAGNIDASGALTAAIEEIERLRDDRAAADLSAKQSEESMTARIAELEAENARLVAAASDLSVGVPSQVVRIAPLPTPDEAFVATPPTPPEQ